MSVVVTTCLPFWKPVRVEPTAWSCHTSVAATVSFALALSWVQLEELSIRQIETVLAELPYQRK